MAKCPVLNNCNSRYDCTWCVNYNCYQPQNKKILSPAQIERKEQRKTEHKTKKHSNASKRGKANKRNGRIAENNLIKLLRSWGLECDKVPLSGALKSEFTVTIDGVDKKVQLNADIWLKINGEQYKIENKRKQNCNKWFNLTDAGVVYIEGFCYVLNEGYFQANILNNMAFEAVQTLPDTGTKWLHKHFAQDDADMVTVFKPYNGFLFFVKEDIYKKLVGGNV